MRSISSVSNVKVDNIYFIGTDFGYRIKTDQTATNSGATTGVTYSNTCMRDVGAAFLFTYLYSTGTGGSPPIIANVKIDNVSGTSKSQGGIVGLPNNLMGVVHSGDTGIRMTNTKLSGGKGFNVTNGTLQLGVNSAVTPLTTGINGNVVQQLPDSGATVVCPSSIVIPPQI